MRILFLCTNSRNELLFKSSLERMHHTITMTDDCSLVPEFVTRYVFDLVILDLPTFCKDAEKLEIISKCRRECPGAAILVLSEAGDAESRMKALEHGADDCLVGAANLKEFEIVINSLTRRYGGKEPIVYSFGPLSLNRETRTVELDGKIVKVTPREYVLLKTLIKKPGLVVKTDEISSHVFEVGDSYGSNLVQPHISRLRSKLKHPQLTISAVYGTGYKLEILSE